METFGPEGEPELFSQVLGRRVWGHLENVEARGCRWRPLNPTRILLNREHELRPRWEEGHVQLYTRQCPVTLARLGPRRAHTTVIK